MKPLFCIAFFCAVATPQFAQQAPAPAVASGLPKNPRAIFTAAAPYYDFADLALKPWHLKATYQLYDADGKPGEQGNYEYWWASPTLYRSSWTRPSATRTEWQIAEGKSASASTGSTLNLLEFKLRSALFDPLPSDEDLDAPGVRLDVEQKAIVASGEKSPCIMVVPKMVPVGSSPVPTPQLGLFPTYCFNPEKPILRIETSFGNLSMQFNDIRMMEGRYLAHRVDFFEGKNRLLSATVESVTMIDPTEPALTPDGNAKVFTAQQEKQGTKVVYIDRVRLGSDVASGMLVKKVVPVYPADAKESHVSGTVLLQAIIGRDGAIHDLKVIQAPWPSLAASALQAVSQWKYKPYVLNGEPVEVDTTVNVIYTLDR